MTGKIYKPKELQLLGLNKANDAVRFFNLLKHTKGEFHGKPFDLLPWEEKVTRDIYGTLKPNGFRQYKNVWVEIPKKQGKSEYLAGMSLKQLSADGEWEAEVYGCAADKGQASIIYDVSVGMLDQLLEDFPEEKSKFKVIESKKRIVYYPTRSFYQVCSAEAYTKHGLNVSTVIFDEIHAQPNRDLYDVMTFGSGDARSQPLYLFITTAGDDPERQSIAWELHKKAEDILLGKRVDPSWYPVIFGFDPEEKRIWKGWNYELVSEEEDWKSRRIWSLVNPSLGYTVQPDKLEEAYTNVIGDEAEEKKFKWLRLNIWVKQRSTKWISQDKWDATAGIIDLEKLKHRECYGGLDLSSKIDVSAFAKIFPPIPGDPYWYLLWRFWIPEENMKERVKRDGVLYERWVKEGFIKATEGNAIDYATIERDILKDCDDYTIKEIAFDPWNAFQMAQNLGNHGLTMVEIRQNFKDMSEPMKYFGSLILDHKIRHGGNPVARWMFGNVDILSDNHENIKPIKDKQGKNRIDGIVAVVNGMSRAMVPEPVSIYETQSSFKL